MTPDKNFKMDRYTKTLLALVPMSKDTKGAVKKIFIGAQLNEESARRAALASKDTGEIKGKTRGAVAPE